MSPARRSAGSSSTPRTTRRREQFARPGRRGGSAPRSHSRAAVAALLLTAVVLAHPGSGIGIDRQGRIFFVDTGEGVWVVEADGRLRAHDGPAFHWMAIDRASAFGATRLQHTAVERHAGGGPRSHGAPVERLSDRGGRRRRALLRGARAAIVACTWCGCRRRVSAATGGVPRRVTACPCSGSTASPRRPDGSIYYSENAAVRRIDAKRRDHDGRERGWWCPTAMLLRGRSPNSRPICAASPSPPTAPSTSPPTAAGRWSGSGPGGVSDDGPAPGARPSRRPRWRSAAATSTRSSMCISAGSREDRKEWVPRVRKLAADGSVSLVVAIDRGAKRPGDLVNRGECVTIRSGNRQRPPSLGLKTAADDLTERAPCSRERRPRPAKSPVFRTQAAGSNERRGKTRAGLSVGPRSAPQKSGVLEHQYLVPRPVLPDRRRRFAVRRLRPAPRAAARRRRARLHRAHADPARAPSRRRSRAATCSPAP